MVYSQVLFNDLEDTVYTSRWINVLVDSGQAYSGSHYAYADAAHPFGLGLESAFADQVKGVNCIMNVEGWVMSNNARDNAAFVITVQKGSDVLYWKDIKLNPLINEPGKWYAFSDSIKIPGGITKDGVVKAYLWNNDLKDTIAIDDLRFMFSPIPGQTFLPGFDVSEPGVADTTDLLLFSNPYYAIYHDKITGKLSFYSTSGQLLIKDIWFFDQRFITDSATADPVRFIFSKAKTRNEQTWLLFDLKREKAKTELLIKCDPGLPEIAFEVESRYKSDQQIQRESLVIESGSGVREVFRANRMSDISDFQAEYWLGKEGARFGVGQDSWFIYHQSGISSMQLNTVKDRLWVNFDYDKDHPLLHFPLDEDTVDLKIDRSLGIARKGENRKHNFSLTLGWRAGHLPRIMKNPNGYLSTYIWSEHADFTDIRTNRAAYYGSEKITHPDSATGGFAAYDIPVTKSVFYANPDSVTNEEISGGTFKSLESTIIDDTAFSNFLDQLYDKGHEICLHTPEQFTSDRRRMEEALAYMRERYEAVSWIDHGYNNLSRNNRENLVCDGLDHKSPHYSLDLWKRNNVRYLWNPYYEDFESFSAWQFGQLLSKPYPGYGDLFPNPDYWRHTGYSEELIHWPTRSVTYYDSDAKWDYHFSTTVLNDLVNNWSVEINHCYPAWVDPEKGFWQYSPNGTIIAREGFNRALQRITNLREIGLLNITTIRDFLDHQLLLENIRYNYLPDGRIRITNLNEQDIYGLSMATRSKRVLVSGKVPEQKKVGEDIIFWTDLPANGSILVRLID